jgi:hypothetical protein
LPRAMAVRRLGGLAALRSSARAGTLGVHSAARLIAWERRLTMRRMKATRVLGVALVGLLLGGGGAGSWAKIGGRASFGADATASGTSVLGVRVAARCRPRWREVPIPRVQSGSFSGVAASSPEDAWAVGSGRYGSIDGPLAEHWDGVRWTIVPTPFRTGALTNVAANAPDDAWAVGWTYGKGRRVYRHHSYPATESLLEHWDGHRWARVQVVWPRLFIGFEFVRGDGAGGGWVFGGERTKAMARHHVPSRDVLLHWDGTAWKRVAVPRGYVFTDLAAVSPEDVWLVGDKIGVSRAVAMHWTGTRWRLYDLTPPSGSDLIELKSVTAVNADDVRIVGLADAAPGDGVLDGETWGVTFRWHAGQWTRRVLDNDFASFDAVAARSAKEVWIVSNDTTQLFLPSQLIRAGRPVEYSAFSHVPAAGTLAADHVVTALGVDPEKDLWAVGYIGSGRTHPEYDLPDYAHFRPLIERYVCS